MITRLYEFRTYLNEANNKKKIVYYRVTNTFSLSDEEGWDVIFPKDQVVEVNPNTGSIRYFNEDIRRWVDKGMTYKEPVDPEVYREFKNNTENIERGEIAGLLGIPSEREFQTTVGKFQQRADDMGLDDDDSIRVRVYKRRGT